MSNTKLIFLLFGEDAELNLRARTLLMNNNRVKVINSEYIPNSHDSGMAAYASLEEGHVKETRRNNSINRFLVNNELPENQYDIILDIDNMSKDLAAKYSRLGADTGHELTSLTVTMKLKMLDINSRSIIFLKHDQFKIVSNMLQRSTNGAVIVSSKDESGRYVELSNALGKSELIIINALLIDSVQEDHFTPFIKAYGYNIIAMEFGTVDVTSSVLKINGKELKQTQKPSLKKEESSEQQSSNSNTQPKKKLTTESIKKWWGDFPEKPFWKRKLSDFQEFLKKQFSPKETQGGPKKEKVAPVRSEEDIKAAAEHIKNIRAENPSPPSEEVKRVEVNQD